MRVAAADFLAARANLSSACNLEKPCNSYDHNPPGNVCLQGCGNPPTRNRFNESDVVRRQARPSALGPGSSGDAMDHSDLEA